MDNDLDPIHEYFGLTYANYLTLPRSVLQSMPLKWQQQFVLLLEQIPKVIVEDFEPKGGYVVQVRGEQGRFRKDGYSNYERGRRRLSVNLGKEKD